MGPELVVALVNTRRISRDEPDGHDELASPPDLDRWWGDALGATDEDLELARTVREGLRGMLAAHNDAEIPGDAATVARLEEVLPSLTLRATTGASVVTPTDERPARAALATVVGAATVARAAGTWERIKICRDPLCREAFLDTTKNRSRTWCAMAVCGARAKQRTFAEKHR